MNRMKRVALNVVVMVGMTLAMSSLGLAQQETVPDQFLGADEISATQATAQPKDKAKDGKAQSANSHRQSKTRKQPAGGKAEGLRPADDGHRPQVTRDSQGATVLALREWKPARTAHSEPRSFHPASRFPFCPARYLVLGTRYSIVGRRAPTRAPSSRLLFGGHSAPPSPCACFFSGNSALSPATRSSTVISPRTGCSMAPSP